MVYKLKWNKLLILIYVHEYKNDTFFFVNYILKSLSATFMIFIKTTWITCVYQIISATIKSFVGNVSFLAF